MSAQSLHPVIFDMDGVIFDSERLLLESWKMVADRYGIPDIEATLARCLGVSVDVSRQIYFDRYGPDFPLDNYKVETRAYFRSQCPNGHPPVKEGARELLAALRARGVPLALASSTRLVTVRRELDEAGLLPFFDAVIGGDTVAHSKPDPEIFLTAASLLDAAPADCWVIEDSFNGVRAAHAGGMHPIMVPDLLPPDAEMEEKAEIIVKDLFEAMAYLLPIV